MIKINNIYLNKYQIDYIEMNQKENTVFVHLQGGTSFLFCKEDCYELLKVRGLNNGDF